MNSAHVTGGPEVGMLKAEGADESTAGIRLHQEVAPQEGARQQTLPEPNSAQQDPSLPTPPQQGPSLSSPPQQDSSLPTPPRQESTVQTPLQQEGALQDIPEQPKGSSLLQQSSEEAVIPEPACQQNSGQQDRYEAELAGYTPVPHASSLGYHAL